ncbi:hypothetical protein CI109_107031 [Kwoniella shandongensis]|uniref:C3H1-type domain-containing protein n=1 Tax=Kwoniella shandongensis TaxID=1734106 RepID=A0A5M6BTA7_9TREE|nr:uncharacterized protein CI109_007441 [Kwoniella shandongensis]KAA5524229.1 hypothetical protein CI109_007441 [Kwoniella shandongensis]
MFHSDHIEHRTNISSLDSPHSAYNPYGAIGNPLSPPPLTLAPPPGLGYSDLSPLADPFQSRQTHTQNRSPSRDGMTSTNATSHVNGTTAAIDVDSELASLIAQAHQLQLERSSHSGGDEKGDGTRPRSALGGERVPGGGGSAINGHNKLWGDIGSPAIGSVGSVRFDNGLSPWTRETVPADPLLTNHRIGTGRAPIDPAPKTAPLPTFQPFSDPQLPPLTPQPYQAQAQAQVIPNQASLYYASSPNQTFPSPINSIAARSSSTKTLAQSPALSHLDPAALIKAHLEGLSSALSPLLAQSDEVQKLRTEVEIWKAEWVRLNDEKRKLESMLAQSSKAKVGPGFTAVLIDGDGLIFQESLIQSGYAGGQRAAQTLLSALPNLAASSSISDNSNGLEVTVEADGTVTSHSPTDSEGKSSAQSKELGSVIVQVFLNKSGLGTALKQTGLVPNWGVYDLFWQGFSAAHELFTVIDVGGGKEATDTKIREYLKVYARNAQCEMIVLGASHDNGYANILSSLQTESRLSKLLLLKGYSDLAPQLKQYSSRVVSIPDLFRTTRVPTTFSSVAAATPSASTAGQSVPAPKSGKKATEALPEDISETTSEDAIEVFEWKSMSNTKANFKKDKKQIQNGKDGKAYAKKNKFNKSASVGESRDNEEWTETSGKKKKDKKRSKKDKEAADLVRNLDPRPCHTFYLSPWGCKNGDDCAYGHEYDLNDRQLDELARLAKSIICPFAKDDRCKFSDEDCVYGHQCPNGASCVFGDTCRFYELPNGHGELD